MDESQEKEEQQTSEPIIQPIIDLGSSLIQTDKGTIYVLTIVGQIEGHQMLPPSSKSTKYEHVLPLLATVEESPQIDGLLILLNNGGGDVEAGLAISELIASMSKPTVSLVAGREPHQSGSAGGFGQTVLSLRPRLLWTIHPVSAQRLGHRCTPDVLLF